MSRKNFSYLALILLAAAPLLLQGCSRAVAPAPEADVAPEISDSQSESNDSDSMDESAAMIGEGSWKLDTDQSMLTYHASRLVGSAHTGTVDIKEGSLSADENGITGGSFVIDMTTIGEENNNERYLQHVMSDDFFGVEEFPEASFEISNVLLLEDGRYEITGDLTIRGISKKIIFFATVAGDADILNVEADFTIDRTRWDITFDSSSFFQNLGDRAIKDLIEFELDLVFEL